MKHHNIPVVELRLNDNTQQYSQSILENEIENIQVEYLSFSDSSGRADYLEEGSRAIYLFIKGTGNAMVEATNYKIVPETILLPNVAKNVTIKPAGNNTLHCIKITCELSEQDHLELKGFSAKNTQGVYFAKFSDCQGYTEPIKSPDTISRTILPNKIIPRVAMGTVQTKGPDEVGAHEHPMLEQLFFGLSGNNCTVYADDAQTAFPEYSVLHIPLGSRHSVSVEEGETLNYIWMDFFLDSKGEEWLDTHIVDGGD